MKWLLIPLLSAAILGCGPSPEVLTRDDPGYFNAEIKIVEMKYFLDDEETREIFSIQGDGSVVADGKVVCRARGTQIETPDGTAMVTIDADGNVAGVTWKGCGPRECDDSGSVLRPDVVLFEEEIPGGAEWQAKRALRDCDFFLAAGTSGTVSPASYFVRAAEYARARTVLVNLEPMKPRNPAYDEEYLGRAEEVLPVLLGS